MGKMTITPVGTGSKSAVITLQYNPTSYSISKSVSWTPLKKAGWRDSPPLEFKGSNARALKLELFFDVSEGYDPPPKEDIPVDVRVLTNKLVALTRRVQYEGGKKANRFHPPAVRVDWGGAGPTFSDFPFIGVIDNLSQNFTLFSPEGRPLRATLSLNITEQSDPSLDLDRSFDQFAVAKVQDQLQNLPSLANKYSGNSKDWRKLADANKLDDPLKLPAGSFLNLPPRDRR